MDKKYKAVIILEKVHDEIKVRASKKGMTIIEYIDYLLKKTND